MNNSNVATMTDVELMNLAKKRVELKRGFKVHLTAYVLINILLVFIYFVTSAVYFWPVWPILGWGIGIAFHGIAISFGLSDTAKSDKVANEYRRLKCIVESEHSNNYNNMSKS